MILEALVTFGMMITHVDTTKENSFTKIVRQRTEVAATAVYNVITRGYEKQPGTFDKVDLLFTHDANGKELTDEESRDATMKLAMSVAFHESAYDQNAHRTIDGSNDCGYMQTKPMWISKFMGPGYTCEHVKKNPEMAIYIGLKTLAFKKAECSEKLSPEAREKMTAVYWLGAFASGKCGHAPKKSRELCGPAGVCNMR